MISKNKKAALVTVSATIAISAIAAPIIWHILHSKKEKETDYKKISELDQKILLLDKDIKINNGKKSEIKNKMDDVENELNELKQVVSLLTGKSIEDKEVFKNNEDYILDFSNVNEGSLLYPLLLKQTELKNFIKNAKITKTNLLEEIEKLTNYYRNTKEELKNELNLLKNEEIELRKEKNRIITKQKYMTAMYKAEILTLESQIAVLNQKYAGEEKRYKELITELNQSIQSLEEENRSLNSELTSTINLLNQTNLTINKLFEKLKEVLLKQKEANSIFKIVNDTYVGKNLTNLIITNDIEIDNALNSDSLQTVQNLVLLLSDNFSKNIRRINENHKTIQTPILNKNLEYVEKLNILLGTSDTYEIGENGSSALEGSLVYDLRQQAHDLELELQELQNNKLNLESRKNELEPVLSSTEGTNSELIRNLQQLNESFSQKNEEINSLNEELRILNNENTSLQQKIDNYKSMLIRLIGTDSQEFNFDNLAKAAQQGIVKDLHDKIAALEASKLESLERLEQEKEQLEQEKIV